MLLGEGRSIRFVADLHGTDTNTAPKWGRCLLEGRVLALLSEHGERNCKQITCAKLSRSRASFGWYHGATEIDDTTRKRIETLLPRLNEADRRLYLAAEAESLGCGGIGAVAGAAGVSRDTVSAGVRELAGEAPEPDGDRFGRPGGGRKGIEEAQPGDTAALLELVDGDSHGGPENPLRRTTGSLRDLAGALCARGLAISHLKVGQLLEEQGFSLQKSQKRPRVGEGRPDGDARSEHINRRVRRPQAEGCPVVSVDCRRKELVGRSANAGGERRPRGTPVEVPGHDLAPSGEGKAAPHGACDAAESGARVTVGISGDTARFAASTLQAWWDEMGGDGCGGAPRLLVCCDGGGSNAGGSGLWRREPRFLCDGNGIGVEVCRHPLGTSKWSKVERRPFSQVSRNRRGRPPESVEVIVSLIASTATEEGPRVRRGVDTRAHGAGVKAGDDETDSPELEGYEWRGDWNYVIRPRAQLRLDDREDPAGDEL